MTHPFLRTCACAFLAVSAPAATYVVDLAAPSIDKNVYPFSPSGGGPRMASNLFGAVGSAGFDDRDSQFYTAFNTASLVPTGSEYIIRSITVTLSVRTGGAFKFDGTYDEAATYVQGGVDGDPGRPVELYGVGYRGGLTNTTVVENTPYGPAGEGTRNLYPADSAGRDVSNNVADAFDPVPFAIGQVAPGDLSGGFVDEDADLVFTLDLTNPDVVRYLQLSLTEGRLSFLTTSLHTASQGGPVGYPELYTKENLEGGKPARLRLEVETVPEPGTALLGILGVAWLAIARRREVGV